MLHAARSALDRQFDWFVLQQNEYRPNAPASPGMLRSPHFPGLALAVEALKIFNQRNIDDLVVINARREPVGLIDLQDLPKLKLM